MDVAVIVTGRLIIGGRDVGPAQISMSDDVARAIMNYASTHKPDMLSLAYAVEKLERPPRRE